MQSFFIKLPFFTEEGKIISVLGRFMLPLSSFRA
jgi:hypothetical protein